MASDWKLRAYDLHAQMVERQNSRRGTNNKPYNDDDLFYNALAMGGESGEAQNVVKKYMRGDLLRTEMVSMLREELADVRVYLELLSRCIEVDLDEESGLKLEKFAKKMKLADTAGYTPPVNNRITVGCFKPEEK